MDKVDEKQISSVTRAYNKFGRLCFNNEFNHEIDNIRHTLNLKTNDSIPLEFNTKFDKMTNSLIIKYKLFALPLKPLHDYILKGIFEYEDRPNYSLSADRNCVIYKIYPDTTAKHILRDWPEIAKLQEKIYRGKIKKNYPHTNLYRDLDVCMFKFLGLKCSNIVKIINKIYPDQDISYQDISKIIKRFSNPPR